MVSKTNSIFHVAILLLPVLIPLLKTIHTLVPSCTAHPDRGNRSRRSEGDRLLAQKFFAYAIFHHKHSDGFFNSFFTNAPINVLGGGGGGGGVGGVGGWGKAEHSRGI